MPPLPDVVAMTEAAAAGELVEPAEVTLRDGRRAQLRPIRPDDKDRLRRGLDWLSPRSRYLAFHMQLDHLTPGQLRYVTEIDHRDHVAWVARDPDDPDAPGMALARYVRLPKAPKVAEAAITVLDRYHGLGLGTIMLTILTMVARANDIEVFRNYVLAENAVMLGMFEELGAERHRLTDEVYEVDFPLPDDPEDLPDTPAGRAMRTLAARPETGRQLAFTLPPVWGRRRPRGRPAEPPIPPTRWRERGPFGDWLDAALDADDDRRPDDGEDEVAAEGE